MDIKNEKLIGQNLFELVALYHKEEEILGNLLARVQKGESLITLRPDTYIRELKANDKFYIKGQISGEYEKGKLDRLLFIFRNIERDLTQEYILNMALSRIKIFPWFYNMDKDRMFIDSRWFSHLGIPEKDCTLTTEEFAGILHPYDRDMLLTALAKQLSGTLTPDIFTYRLRRGDGTWEWFEARSIYLGKINGLPYRIVGVCQSIQDHKNIEEKLTAARDKAQESDKLKSAFLANMSHEIRTPLNAIVGFSNLLTSGEVSLEDKETQEYTRLINTNSEQLLMLISDILDLSKIESNTMEFHYSEETLDLLLSDICRYQKLHISSTVELKLDLPEKETVIEVDPMRLKQVINNLINNAIKFTSQGSITLGYRLMEDHKMVEIYVKDTGAGIAEDKIKHIFERFYKANSFVKGVGLGLSICKTISEYMGGNIMVTSKVDIGTCFTIHLPLKQTRI